MIRRRNNRRIGRGIVRGLIHVFVWSGIAVIYYFIFSFFFDTPAELKLRGSTRNLEHQYEILDARYDSLVMVLENVAERDKNVFQMLFESDPYDFDGIGQDAGWLSYERLIGLSNKELGEEYFVKLTAFGNHVEGLADTYARIQERTRELGDGVNRTPSIQPVVNNDLTLLTASYGLRIHPFFRKLMSHGGVDYTVAEGTPVFATADGTVQSVATRNTGSGLMLMLDHGNGYQTVYSHLSRSSVYAGQRVRRGDIIARTGNTGLSLTPHLHYEVRKDGMRVDPVHYFFMELSPDNYQRIIRIAGSGMQSFD